MTGTGTQQDPFVPQDWDDFVTAIGTSEAYVELPVVPVKTQDEHIMNGKLYFDSQGNKISLPEESHLDSYYENGFVLDANAYAPMGIRLNFNGVTLNGNGASIINCYVPNDTCGLRFGGNSTIKNINFLNFYSESNDYYGVITPNSGSDYLLTENVQFSGFITRGAFCGVNGSPAFKSTTFSITFGTSASFINNALNDSNKYYQFCLFDFYGSPSQLFGSTYGNKILNCKMTGTLKGVATNYPLFPSDGSSTTNVIDMDVTEYQNAQFNYNNGNSHNPYIINTDKIASGTTHVGITGVTTQQLQDASYLRSIGFPVGD